MKPGSRKIHSATRIKNQKRVDTSAKLKSDQRKKQLYKDVERKTQFNMNMKQPDAAEFLVLTLQHQFNVPLFLDRFRRWLSTLATGDNIFPWEEDHLEQYPSQKKDKNHAWNCKQHPRWKCDASIYSRIISAKKITSSSSSSRLLSYRRHYMSNCPRRTRFGPVPVRVPVPPMLEE